MKWKRLLMHIQSYLAYCRWYAWCYLRNTDFVLRMSSPVVLTVSRLSTSSGTFPILTSGFYEMSEKVQGVGLGFKSDIKFSGETTAWEEAAKCRLWRQTFWIEFMLHHLFSEWPWASCLISICLSFFIVWHASSTYTSLSCSEDHSYLLQKANKYLACNKQ